MPPVLLHDVLAAPGALLPHLDDEKVAAHGRHLERHLAHHVARRSVALSVGQLLDQRPQLRLLLVLVLELDRVLCSRATRGSGLGTRGLGLLELLSPLGADLELSPVGGSHLLERGLLLHRLHHVVDLARPEVALKVRHVLVALELELLQVVRPHAVAREETVWVVLFLSSGLFTRGSRSAAASRARRLGLDLGLGRPRRLGSRRGRAARGARAPRRRRRGG